MRVRLSIDEDVRGLVVALVEATNLQIAPSPKELRDYCHQIEQRMLSEGLPGGDQQRGEVRQLLRHGGFKPAGRSKPAQEYLLRTVIREHGLPHIFNAVDLINAVSLDGGWPISLVSVDRVGPELMIRYGSPGERYVFNRTGQELDLAGLICICSVDEDGTIPRGSPVKDSMAAKVTEEDRHVLACIFAPANSVESETLKHWGAVLQQGFSDWCGAAETRCWLVPVT